MNRGVGKVTRHRPNMGHCIVLTLYDRFSICRHEAKMCALSRCPWLHRWARRPVQWLLLTSVSGDRKKILTFRTPCRPAPAVPIFSCEPTLPAVAPPSPKSQPQNGISYRLCDRLHGCQPVIAGRGAPFCLLRLKGTVSRTRSSQFGDPGQTRRAAEPVR